LEYYPKLISSIISFVASDDNENLDDWENIDLNEISVEELIDIKMEHVNVSYVELYSFLRLIGKSDDEIMEHIDSSDLIDGGYNHGKLKHHFDNK
jgi:hypothetical protein